MLELKTSVMHKVMEVLAVKLNLILKQKTSVESHICI